MADRRRPRHMTLRQWWVWAVALACMACAGTATVDVARPVAIAVWDLEDLSPVAHGQPDMGVFLAGQVTERIGETPGYQVVERQELLKALGELNVGSSELASNQTRLSLGRITGAQQMVFGAFQVAGRSLRIDLRLVDVATGKVLKTATGMATAESPAGWLPAADQAATQLVAP